MQKIVTNRCYGGFSLSEQAIHKYADLAGLTLYPEVGRYNMTTYWTVPGDQRPKKIEWAKASLDERQAYNKASSKSQLYNRDIARDDPFLIQAVEELGEAANGGHAELQVTEIPDGVEWEICEYDGMEWVAEKHETW